MTVDRMNSRVWQMYTFVEPIGASLAFYVSVFILAEFARRSIALILPAGSLSRKFAYELIATSQMCTCVYENGLVIKHFGPVGFFLIVTILLIVGSFVNRGAFVSPLGSIEAFVFQRITSIQFIVVFFAELIGGYSAFRLAKQLWYFGLSHDHLALYRNFYCTIAYRVPYVQVAIYEVIGCFIIRYIISKTSESNRRYVASVTVAAFLTFALTFIGVPGLNPIVASSRLQGCHGLSTVWFLLTYWLCPIFGALLAATYQNSLEAKIKSN